MRPQLNTNPRAVCLRNQLISPMACGVPRGYACATPARMRSSVPKHSGALRPVHLCRIPSTVSEQKRWITQNYIRRMKEADDRWAHYAEEIKAGKRKSFVEHLEDRCLIKDYVGLVACPRICSDAGSPLFSYCSKPKCKLPWGNSSG